MTRPYIMRKGVSTLNDLVDGYSAIMAVAKNVYHVDQVHENASDSNNGDDPNKPLATIAKGYERCNTAGDTDVIFIKGADRYRENELVCEKDNVQFIGAGWGVQWNRTSSQTGDYVLKVHGVGGVGLYNLHLSGQDLTEDVIYWGEGTTGDAPSFGVIQNCLISAAWWTATPAGTTKGLTLVSPTFMRIQDNFIYACGTGIDIQDGSEKTSHGLIIEHNKICCGSYGIRWYAGYGYTSVIEDNTIWDWSSTVNMTYGISLSLNTGGVLVTDNKIGCLAPAYDSGDTNYWVHNKIRNAEAESEAFAATIEDWC